jgi:hypothetical protein
MENFKDVISLYFERSAAMQTYWNFYVTIILAYIVYFAADKHRTKLVASSLAAAFIMFALANLGGLREVTHERLALRCIACTLAHSPAELQLFETLDPPEFWCVALIHIAGDVFILGGIWYLALRRKEPAHR